MNRCNILLLCSLFIVNCYAQTPFDELVDEVLWEAQQKMINESKTNFVIPDISYPVEKRFLLWDIKGDINVKGGYVGNLSTIQRIGDINPVETSNLVITATFGLTDLFVHFDEIQVDIFFFHLKEGFDIKIDKNAITFNITFQYDSDHNCTVILNKAELASLGGFHTTLLPDNFIHKVADFFVTGAMDLISFEIKNVINTQLTDKLNGVIQELDLCDKLPMATKTKLLIASSAKSH